jgi:hypothetical protein
VLICSFTSWLNAADDGKKQPAALEVSVICIHLRLFFSRRCAFALRWFCVRFRLRSRCFARTPTFFDSSCSRCCCRFYVAQSKQSSAQQQQAQAQRFSTNTDLPLARAGERSLFNDIAQHILFNFAIWIRKVRL